MIRRISSIKVFFQAQQAELQNKENKVQRKGEKESQREGTG